MTTVYDVPANMLIKRLAEELRRKYPQVNSPGWASYVKTGSHVQRPPQDKDWWYTRSASMLRKIYLHGPIGHTDLRSEYGGSWRVSYAAKHHRNAGGSAIAEVLQQLEEAGLVIKEATKGRIVTSRGRGFLDRLSNEIFKALKKVDPRLEKYS